VTERGRRETGSLTGTAVIEAVGLTKAYRRGPEEIHAVRHADRAIGRGELVALVGPSGSGKTTLLNLLIGWERPDEGEVRWGGSRVEHPDDLRWGELSVVPQSLGLVEELSVRENVALPLRLRGAQYRDQHGAAERVESLLGEFGLARLADRLPTEVSLGEQQRAALARGLVLEPSLLVADEPTGHQDAVWVRGVLRALRHAADSGSATLVATHHRALARFADRVLAIRDGELEAMDAGSVAAGDEL
jgi:ABC-type lipoprotein export system ATPase subunit